MIPEIQEIGFGPGTAKSYATLHQATVSLQEMGERTISTQVRIDGDVVPDFTGWELMFKGERFVLPSAVPQASKDNTTRNALVDLNFTSWIILELKRYYFMSLSQIDAGTAIADKYKASVILPLKQFVELFNRVLKYYFGDTVRMDLFQPDIYSTTPIAVDIDYTHIWDVLLKFYELFNVRWTIAVDNGVYVIKVGYAADSIDDHDFEYGYEGGLLRFERQVQDENITNILLGRGGEKNLPYRYFKQQDPQNPEWTEDPDAIPELANIYFDRLRDAAFRWYVRGWMQNPNRDTSWDATHTFPTYSDVPEEYQYAYNRGRTDAKFNPVEFAKDDDSIAKYGERWGALDDNDEIHPTIHGVIRDPMGRVDEVIAVSDIITDDIQAASENAAVETNVQGATMTVSVPTNAEHQELDHFSFNIRGKDFTVPEGQIGNFDKSGEWALTFNYYTAHPYMWPTEYTFELSEEQKKYLSTAILVDTTRSKVRVYSKQTDEEVNTTNIPAGDYYYKLHIYLNINIDMILNATAWGVLPEYILTLQLNMTAGTGGMLLVSSAPNTDEWKPTFDIWVKNIWETTQGQGESDEDYATRVWRKILGDRLGNEAKIVFSDGFMSISEDYEFQIASYPVVDRSKTFIDSDGNTYQSEWKITLRKSDAEFEATGLFIPNASASGKPRAGDHFFFIGIDMPFQYVEWAEEQVHASKLESLQGTSDINPTWVINLDKVRVHTVEEADYGTALADRLAAGATVWIKDKRFTPGERLQLFVQSITYTWNEPSDGSPYLVPDIEVVLSDKVNASEGVVQKLQGSVDVIRSTYAKTSDLEAVVRRVATPLFLKKTGENDSSESPTTFSSKLSSKNFRQGDIGGAGWGFYKDGDDESVLELDKIVVRHEMRVNTLVSNQISYVGGKQITSAASIECTQVVDATEGYYCYFDQKNGTVANLFVVGDFAMVQDFNPENVERRYYRARVDEVGLNYILLSKTVTDGSGEPKEGDVIIQYGNESVAARQYVIIRDVIGGGYERMLSDLNSVNAAGKEYYFAGRLSGQNPRWFVGDSLGEYAEWANGRLNIKGTLIVRNADGSYQAMTDYMASVQRQIDGQIQSWSSGQSQTQQTEPYPQVVDDVVDPTTANFPASSWALDTDREQHFGDIYVDDSTGQGYRYTKRVYNGVTEYYWTRITDEEVAEAMRLAQLANTRVAGLEYLKEATNNGATLIDGGLILSNLMALGQTINQQFQVNAGINGIMNAGRTRIGGGIAAWFGGDISDKDDLDQGVTAYAKSIFRFDGSGYLAGGNIHWDSAGYGGIPGITWIGNDIIIGGNVKLASLTGDSVTDLINAVRKILSWFGEDANGDIFVQMKNAETARNFYGYGEVTAGGVGSSSGGGGGGGSTDLLEVWSSLQAYTGDYGNWKINTSHFPSLNVGAGLSASYSTPSGSGASMSTSLNIGVASGYTLPTTTAFNAKIERSNLWASLQNNDIVSTYNNYKIHVNHIPDLSISKVTGLQTALDGKQATISDLSTIRSNASIGATAYNALPNYLPLNGGLISGTLIAFNSAGLPTYGGIEVPASRTAIGYNGIAIAGIDTATDGAAIFMENAGTEKNRLVIALGDDRAQAGTDDWIEFRHYNTSGNYASIKVPFTAGTLALTSDLSAYLPLTGGSMSSGAYVTLASTDEYLSGYGYKYTGGIQLREYAYSYTTYSDTAQYAPGITFLWSGRYVGKLSLYEDKLHWDTNVIWHSGNSNLTSVAWSASSLTLAQAGGINFLFYGTHYDFVGLGSGATVMFGNGAFNTEYRGYAHFFFNSSGSELMRINESGNVGIGTTSPQYKLDVNGDIGVANCLKLKLVSGTISPVIQSAYGEYFDQRLNLYLDSSSVDWNIFDDSSNVLVRVKRATGNVGIGVTSPAYKLDVDGAVASETFFTRKAINAQNGKLVIGQPSSGYDDGIYYNTNGNWFRIQTQMPFMVSTTCGDTAIATRYDLYIGTSGYVGLGTNTPSYKLDVSGTFRATGDSIVGGTLSVTGATTLSSTLTVTGSAYLDSTVRIGGSSGATLTYESAYGGLRSDKGIYSPNYITAGGVNASSDQRLKSNISRVSGADAIAVIMALKPSEWVWNEKHYQNGQKGAGFIAQDVQGVLPFAVSHETEYLSLNHNVFHAYEISGLQNHETRIEKLEREGKEKDAKIAELETRIARLTN